LRISRTHLIWALVLFVAFSSGGCSTGGTNDFSTAPPPGFDPDAGPYLARGTWDYSGSGDAEARGITCDAYVTDGVVTIGSTGDAGDETVTETTNAATVRVDCGVLGTQQEMLSGSTVVDEDVVDNHLKIEDQGLTYEYFLMSDTTAEAHVYGTRDVDGTSVKMDLWLSCVKRTG
jgi:hypothetical protein